MSETLSATTRRRASPRHRRRERGLYFKPARFEQEDTSSWLSTRRATRHMHASEMAASRDVRGDVEEEPQRGDGGVDARRADLLLGQMQLIEATSSAVAASGEREKHREVPHVAEVILLTSP